MELRQLRYIIAVAEERNVTRAAERLGMRPPPLSRQIRAIELEIDAQLFRRKPRGVELTDTGRAFLDNARAVLAQVDHTFEATRRTARGEQGRISVGYSSSVAFHALVPRVIREFREAFPLVTVTLVEQTTERPGQLAELTVTVKEQLVTTTPQSKAEQVTVVEPSGKEEPLGGLQPTEAGPRTKPSFFTGIQQELC